ncbi:hypothetical protein HDV03_002865 [Kappamyces sp. JEL0829]|nr:hypothetical protein HDV03_002865 [Kappamyces sp. JEL0829]
MTSPSKKIKRPEPEIEYAAEEADELPEDEPNNFPTFDFRLESNFWRPTEAESLLIMDVDAYNFLCAALFDGNGAEPRVVQLDLDGKRRLFRDELLSNVHLFDVLAKEYLVTRPTLQRIHSAIAILAMEELHTLRDGLEAMEEASLREKYVFHKRISICYQRFLGYMLGEALSTTDKEGTLFVPITVEFKTYYFISEMAAGSYVDGEHNPWPDVIAREKVRDMLRLTPAEQGCLSPQVAAELALQLENRVSQLLTAIDSGEIQVPPSESTEQELVTSITEIVVQANTAQLPILLPEYNTGHSLRLQRKAYDRLEDLRLQRKSMTERLDPLGVVRPRSQQSIDVGKSKRQRNSDGLGTAFKAQARRKPWTAEEDAALEAGIAKFGHSNWSQIRDEYASLFQDRNNVSLKDRARTIRKNLVKAGEALGVFEKVSL